MCREELELDQSSGYRTRQGGAKAFQIRVRLHEQKPKQQLADVSERLREGNELGQLNSIRTRQVSTKALHFRAHSTDKNQNSNWQMCQRSVGMATNSASRKASERGKSAQTCCTAERSCTDKNQNSNWRMCQKSVGKATNSVGRTASERAASQRKRVAQPCAVARTRTKTATGGCAKKASGRQRTRSAEKHQNAASQRKALHIRAQLHGQEPKQQLADVPKKRREGDELGQPRSIRTRLVSERRCTSERSCTDKNQNSNWRMCQRAVGMATNSVSRKASERGKAAGCGVKMYQKANMRKNRCFWGFTAIQAP